MHAISEVAKPGGYLFRVDILDSGVVVAAGYRLAGDGDPIRVAAVQKGEVDSLGLLDVVEFLAVAVGDEEEVRARALRDRHGTCDRLQVKVRDFFQ